MKRLLPAFVAMVIAASCGFAIAAESNQPAVRIGVYDSRAVAYAWFWSDAGAEKQKALLAAVAAAKKSGDAKKIAESEKSLKDARDENHRQVFSTAPVDDVLAAVKDRLPDLKEKANVTELVSKWDEVALKKYPAAEKVDVTDELIHEFLPQPKEKQLKVIGQIKKSIPVPLEKADELIRDGKL
jgi:hypothetical protein